MIKRIEKYGADWCQPCKVLEKTLSQVTGVTIVKYDADEDEALFNEKNIRSIPVLIFYDENDNEVKRTTGAVSLNTIMDIINN